MPRRILVVDDDPAMRALVARHVRRRAPDATVLEAASAEEALLLLEGSGGDGLTVVADLHLGAGMDGGRLLAVVHERHPHARRVLLTG
ncbi:MAG TPA: response regulator, partial [Candidatus Thermoplasmatota archaeon]|nr:response regulator [Candidatus Thermoplasmatota archaeon]